VVEIEKSPSRQLDEMLWNLLPERRHETEIGTPVVHHQFVFGLSATLFSD
jgi:hypothetical protein